MVRGTTDRALAIMNFFMPDIPKLRIVSVGCPIGRYNYSRVSIVLHLSLGASVLNLPWTQRLEQTGGLLLWILH